VDDSTTPASSDGGDRVFARGQPELSTAEALSLLERGEVTTQHGMIRNSSNYTFLVTLTYEKVEALAIYKPRRGERPLWDFPDNTLADRERASFVLSEALNWGLVPPTALRDGPHGIGSVQWFVPHDPSENYFTFGDRVQAQLKRVALFDCITNNADRKGGHLLLGSGDRVWCIDNGLTFNQAHKLRTVIWDFEGEEIPSPLLADVRGIRDHLCDESDPLYCAMADLLSQGEISATLHRIDRVLKSRRYPRPGGGANYPWPPV